MKVVVANGATHCLTRMDVETIVKIFPATWNHKVKEISLFNGSESGVEVFYHPKAQRIDLRWAPSASSIPAKAEAIQELLIAMAIVNNLGEIPNKLKASLRNKYMQDTTEIRNRCLQLIGTL
jgi:hypothetical protein